MKRIVIIGGGIMGSCSAYYLALAGHADQVVVVEPDPTYEIAATPRAVGGVRLQHALRENVQMSLYGDEIYSNFANTVTGGLVEFDPNFRRNGYLYLVRGAAGLASLEANVGMQQDCGVDVSIYDRAALRSMYPSFTFDGVEAGALSPGDGSIDPYAALMGVRRAAEGRGIMYLKDRVVGLDTAHGLVSAVKLESGTTLDADIVVNAANCWSAEIAAMVGMTLPVAPMRRQQFYFLTQDAIEPIPAMRDMDGLAVRRHQNGYLCGHTNWDEARGFNWELQHGIFDNELWPALAQQCSKFESIKYQSGWVGHYDMNALDGNMILDRWTGHLDNFIVACGFSGHGLQHGPAVGRAVSEMILHGRSTSIDLTRMGYQRVVDNVPLPDDGPKA